MIILQSCPKAHTHELDKALSPTDTVARVKAALDSLLQSSGTDILTHTSRVDVGRLGIPVYISHCGADAKRIMPTRKQMGKGATAIQAEASALMELMERYAFFSFWEDVPHCIEATWQEAEARFGEALMPIEYIAQSVNETLAKDTIAMLMDTVRWQFFPLTDLVHGKCVWVPLNWFKKLGEFNGTSAGNTQEESLLQGLCELIERHVCCLIDRERLLCPTIDPESMDDVVLKGLVDAFAQNNITLVLKDFSLHMPVPTVGAVAYDAATLGKTSEIVFTAGTATSPAKAAIRAITEVAQLAGDFCTSACYEASGLSKFTHIEDIEWLKKGHMCALSDLPSILSGDICTELQELIHALHAQGFTAHALATTHPRLGIDAHYCIVPGLAFRERDVNQSVGLFVGRILAEECDLDEAQAGLEVIAQCYPKGHFLPFFQGMLALRQEEYTTAHDLFALAEPLQPEHDAKGLAAFYAAYALSLEEKWEESLPFLHRAIVYCPDMKEYWNLRGVAYFKQQDYQKAAENFRTVLALDKGSVMDMANLGVCYKFLGKKEEARTYLQAALDFDDSLDFARQHLRELIS